MQKFEQRSSLSLLSPQLLTKHPTRALFDNGNELEDNDKSATDYGIQQGSELDLEPKIINITVTKPDGTILHFNDVLLQLWGLEKEDLMTGQPRAGIDKVKAQVIDPDMLDIAYQSAQGNRQLKIYDILPLKDGRYIERISRPLDHNNKQLGRIWFFRDITAIKTQEEQPKKGRYNTRPGRQVKEILYFF